MVTSVGIDLAGSDARPTGFCVMKEDMRAWTFIVYTDAQILGSVASISPDVVAVDAPLCLPKGRRSLEERVPIHFRQCDLALRELGIRFFPITIGPMRALTERGMRLAGKLRSMGYDVIEVFPGGAQDVLGLPRKQRGLGALREGLEELGVKGLRGDETGDELDAVTSALVGLMYLKGDYTALGDPEEGLIIMPKVPEGWHARRA